jgi:trans-aconitate methyltransferase
MTVLALDRVSAEPSLAELATIYASDKGSTNPHSRTPWGWAPHNYTVIYELLFAAHRNVIQTVVECGIGTNNTDVLSNMTGAGTPGASLRMWRDYFPNALIVGLDVDERILFQDDRIRTYGVDQTERSTIQEFWEVSGLDSVDVFIDDGLHEFHAGVSLFEESIRHIAPGGFYIVEDVTWRDLARYRDYFSTRPYDVTVFSLHRPGELLGDNSLVVVRTVPEQ